MNKQYIAIFDSGVGGFTALINAVRQFPNENFLFYADTRNVPYGEKSADTIKKLTLASVASMMDYEIKAIVIACNTATSAAAIPLRKKYDIPILGMEPAINPALRATKDHRTANRVLLFSTLLTMQGEKLSNLIDGLDADKRVDCVPLSELVGFAEDMDFSSQRVINYLENHLQNRDLNHYGAIVLGCTHFIWYRELFETLLPSHIKIFDGNVGTLNHLEQCLKKQNTLSINPQNDREVILHFTKSIDDTKARILEHALGIPVKWL